MLKKLKFNKVAKSCVWYESVFGNIYMKRHGKDKTPTDDNDIMEMGKGK